MTVKPSYYQASPRLNNLPVYVFAWLDALKEKARARGADLIDLGMGNPDLPTPAPIVNAIQTAWDNPANHRYPPFKGTPAFRHAVVDWMKQRYNVAMDAETQVLCLSGCKEGLANITMAYIDTGDISLVPEIYYPVHSRATWLNGGDVYHLPVRAEDNFLADLDSTPAQARDKARLLFLNYPNNPTGAVATPEYYAKAVTFCKANGIVLVSDMAYCETVYDGYRSPSIFEIPGAESVAVEFYSFSKSFNMAGSRIGFAVGHPEIIQNLYSLRTNVGYGTPVPIQEGATYALQHGMEFLPEIVSTYHDRRDIVVQGFQSLGWDIQSTLGTLYVWLKVPRGFSAQSWTEYLIDTADVVVSPGNAFGPGGEGYFRVSLVTPAAALSAAFDRLKAHGICYQA